VSADQAATPADERRLTHGVGGFLAAFSLAGSLVGIAWHPLRLIPLSIFLALLSTALRGRDQTLPFVAVCFGALAFVAGMAVAVATSNPIW
jgi:hypothetical protein